MNSTTIKVIPRMYNWARLVKRADVIYKGHKIQDRLKGKLI